MEPIDRDNMARLTARVNELDAKLVEVQGALMCAHDLFAALMKTHPNPEALAAVLPTEKPHLPNQYLAAYRLFQKGLPQLPKTSR